MGAPPALPKRPGSRASTSALSGLLQTASVPALMADAAAMHVPGLGVLTFHQGRFVHAGGRTEKQQLLAREMILFATTLVADLMMLFP